MPTMFVTDRPDLRDEFKHFLWRKRWSVMHLVRKFEDSRSPNRIIPLLDEISNRLHTRPRYEDISMDDAAEMSSLFEEIVHRLKTNQSPAHKYSAEQRRQMMILARDIADTAHDIWFDQAAERTPRWMFRSAW